MTTETGSEVSGNPAENNGGSENQGFDFTSAVGSVGDEELKGWIENKGFDSVDKMATSYRNLEQMFGADKAGRTVIKPGDNATPEELDGFYKALGRPDTPDDYGFTAPEGEDPAFTTFAKGMFHEAGVSDSQAAKLVETWNSHMAQQSEDAQAAYQAQVQQDEAALKKEWGGAYDKHVNVAKQAAREFGMDETQVDALEKALGFSGLMKFMHNVGSKLSEDSFENNETGGNNPGFNGLTPGQAQSRISELKADPAFRKRYMAGDKDAQSTMDALHHAAYGDHS